MSRLEISTYDHKPSEKIRDQLPMVLIRGTINQVRELVNSASESLVNALQFAAGGFDIAAEFVRSRMVRLGDLLKEPNLRLQNPFLHEFRNALLIIN
jgi:hypothetical protein